LEHDPENPDAWFLRAQGNLAVGNAAAAKSDFDHALSFAPDRWSQRPDVTRFLTKLNLARP
jgi:Tfp pilus assembly protein PilF